MEKKKPRGKPFQKGQSGNPKGRTKGEKTLTSVLREYCDQTIEVKEKNGTIAEKIQIKELLARNLVSLAVYEKHFPALRYIYDRLEGMPTLQAELAGKDGGPIKVDTSKWKEKIKQKLAKNDSSG